MLFNNFIMNRNSRVYPSYEDITYNICLGIIIGSCIYIIITILILILIKISVEEGINNTSGII